MTTRLNENTVRQATEALVKHLAESRQKAQEASGKLSLETDAPEDVFLSLTLGHIQARERVKPFCIPLANPIYSLPGREACLIVKDQSDVIAALEEAPIDGVTRVIPFTKLRKEFKSFKDRRVLRDAFDLFLCDDRVLEYMMRTLGTSFFGRSKRPVPVRLSRSGYRKQIERTLASTFLHLGTGPCIMVRIGSTAQGVDAIVENVVESFETVVSKIPRKRKGLQSVHLKGANSVALPLYSRLPGSRSAAAADADNDDDAAWAPELDLKAGANSARRARKSAPATPATKKVRVPVKKAVKTAAKASSGRAAAAKAPAATRTPARRTRSRK